MAFDPGRFMEYANRPDANFTSAYTEIVELIENQNQNPEGLIHAANQQIDMVEQLMASGEERVLTPDQTGMDQDFIINSETGPELIEDAHAAFMAARTYQHFSGSIELTELISLFLRNVDFNIEEERQRVENLVSQEEREEEERLERERQEAEERQRQEEERLRREEEERRLELDILEVDRLSTDKQFYSRGW